MQVMRFKQHTPSLFRGTCTPYVYVLEHTYIQQLGPEMHIPPLFAPHYLHTLPPRCPESRARA